MTPFSILSPAQIHLGRGTASRAAAMASRLGQRILFVHGKTAARTNWLRRDLEAEGCAITPIACAGEPTLEDLQDALRLARAQQITAVVACGGGSAIDLAKALAALLPTDADPMDHLEVVGKALPLPAPPLPMLALPTTAGTGAEVTKNAVIGVPEHARKVSLRDPRMIPDIVIVDPALSDGSPRAVTLAAGLDALTQVIEPYISSRANLFTDALCRPAIEAGLTALPRLIGTENPEDRDTMSWVSLCGGLALANAGLGAVHGLAGVLGGRTGAPHGAICGALLPHILRFNRAAPDLPGPIAARIDWVTERLGAGFGSKDPLQALADWARAEGLPGLGQMGLTEAAIPDIAKDAALSSSMKANPVILPQETLQNAMRGAF